MRQLQLRVPHQDSIGHRRPQKQGLQGCIDFNFVNAQLGLCRRVSSLGLSHVQTAHDQTHGPRPENHLLDGDRSTQLQAALLFNLPLNQRWQSRPADPPQHQHPEHEKQNPPLPALEKAEIHDQLLVKDNRHDFRRSKGRHVTPRIQINRNGPCSRTRASIQRQTVLMEHAYNSPIRWTWKPPSPILLRKGVEKTSANSGHRSFPVQHPQQSAASLEARMR